LQKASFAAEYDGRTDFRRYAFGTDATGDEAGDATPVLGIIRYGDTGHLLLTYKRRVNDPRVQYLIEGTDDLTNWRSAHTRFEEVLSSAVDEDFETVVNVDGRRRHGAPAMQFFESGSVRPAAVILRAAKDNPQFR
jgi:hypothetical protein